jgi:hypothetical protein
MKQAAHFAVGALMIGLSTGGAMAAEKASAPMTTEVPAESPPQVIQTVVAAPSAPATPATSAESPLPPMSFYSSVATDELLTRLKSVPAFGKVEKELYGSPIQVRITHSLQPTAGGQAAGLLSAIWAGSTLGLLPVVTNNNLVLTYEIQVNGKDVAHYEFNRSFTRAINIWSEKNDPTYGLGAEGIEWVRTTVDEFAAKAAKEPAVLELAKEHQFYFGAEKT